MTGLVKGANQFEENSESKADTFARDLCGHAVLYGVESAKGNGGFGASH